MKHSKKSKNIRIYPAPERSEWCRVKSKVWLDKDGELIFGDGKVRVLKAIEQTHSINKAAKKLNMSFRHAWGYITAIEKRLGIKLVEKIKGGKNGGGSYLTKEAKGLIAKYKKLQDKVNRYVDREYKKIFNK